MSHLSRIKRFLVSTAFLGAFSLSNLAFAQSADDIQNDGAYWLGADLQKKLFKGFRLGLTPELRSLGWSPNRYMITMSAKYKPIDYVAVKAGYRASFIDDEEDGLRIKNRMAFDLLGMLPLGDFEPGVRLRYTGVQESEKDFKSRLRYKGKLKYSIKPADLTLAGFGEAFHDLNNSLIARMRYGVSVEYEFYKAKKAKGDKKKGDKKKGDKKKTRLSQSVTLGYHIDYQLNDYRNIHVAELGYGLTF